MIIVIKLKRYSFFLYLLIFVTFFTKQIKAAENIKTISQIRIENVNLNTYSATPNGDERLNSKLSTNLFNHTSFGKNWFALTNIRLEKLKSENSENKNYGDEGIYLRELKFGYEDDNFAFYTGKFRPFFGFAWRNGKDNWAKYYQNSNDYQFDLNNARGINTDLIAQNYSQSEKLGFHSVLKAGNEKEIGKYELAFSLFTNDNNFNKSLFLNRDKSYQSNISHDVNKLQSYNISLDVSFDFSKNEKLFYRFSYIDLAVNKASNQIPQAKIANQKGFSYSMNYQYPFSDNFNVNSLIEYVKMRNINGNSDIDNDFLTTSFIANIFSNWNLVLGYSKQRAINNFNPKNDLYFREASFGYNFNKNEFFDVLSIQFGYNEYHEKLNNVKLKKQDKIGGQIIYIKNF